MLFLGDVTEYTGHIFKKTGVHVLNTDRVFKHYDKDGSSCDVFYSENPRDRRSQPMQTVVALTEAEIQAEMDSIPSSSVLGLSIFPDNDITQTPVDKTIPLSDFIHAHTYRKNADYSVVTMIEGFHIKKVFVVSQSITDIMESVGSVVITFEYASPATTTVRLKATGSVLINWGEGTVETVTPSSTTFTNYSHAAGTTITVIGPNVVTAVGGAVFNSNLIAVDIPETATNIKEINFWASYGLAGLTTYAAWTNLESLFLNECPLPTSITTHSEWTKLKTLGLYGTDITSVTTYGSEWSQLETLDVAFTNITSISTYIDWTQLTYLSFQGTDVASVTTYAEWVNLYRIYGWGCPNLTSFTTHKEWTAMNTILIGSNNFSSFICHPEWTDFYYFSLQGCSNLTSFTTHPEWTNLWSFDVSDTGLTALTTYNTWTNLGNISVDSTAIASIVTHPEWTLLSSLNVSSNNLSYVEAHQEWVNIFAFRAQICNITSATDINNILIELDTTGMDSGTILLYGGTNAAPTGAGITAKNNLIGRGVTVTTN